MVRMHNIITSSFFGSFFLAASVGFLTYTHQQRYPIASLQAEIDELKEQINQLSFNEKDFVEDDEERQQPEIIMRSRVKLPDKYPIYYDDDDEESEYKQSPGNSAELRGARKSSKNEMQEENDSSWKRKSARKLKSSMMSMSMSMKSKGMMKSKYRRSYYSYYSYYSDDRDVGPVATPAVTVDQSQTVFETRMLRFLNDFLTDIQGLSTETERLNKLTKELDTIASYLDTPASRRLSDYIYQESQRVLLDSFNNLEDSSLSVTEEADNLTGQMNASLRELEYQKGLLGSSNGRMSEINVVLRDSVVDTVNRNRDLMGQNDELQGSVDNLSGEVERLQNERNLLLRQIGGLEGDVGGLMDTLDEHQRLIDLLKASVTQLNQQNQILDDSNLQYEALNAQLNESIAELQAQNQYLEEQNGIFAGLNTNLDTTAEDLSNEVDRLAGEINDLEEENNRLSTLVGSLNDEIDTLSGLNVELNETVQELSSEVDRLSGENDRLEVLTSELSSIASFLNETTIDANESFEAVTDFLSDQIAAYRSVVLETIQNTYIQRVSLWDCSFRDVFNNEGFINNGAVPIPRGIYAEVMNYIDDRILSDLCLSIADFEDYLEVRFGERPTTMNHLVSGVEGYTTAALDYYFPDSGEEDSGLTMEDWANAGYACENLTEEQNFVFGVSAV